MLNMARVHFEDVLLTIKQALIPHRPNQRQAIWAVRIVIALAVVIFILILGVYFGFGSSTSAEVVAALLALAGVLITQMVNTNIAHATQRNQLFLEDQRARKVSLQ